MGCNRVLLWVASDAGHGCTLVPVLLSGPVLFLPAVPVWELPAVYGENQSLKKCSQVFAFSFFQKTGEMFNSLQALT